MRTMEPLSTIITGIYAIGRWLYISVTRITGDGTRHATGVTTPTTGLRGDPIIGTSTLDTTHVGTIITILTIITGTTRGIKVTTTFTTMVSGSNRHRFIAGSQTAVTVKPIRVPSSGMKVQPSTTGRMRPGTTTAAGHLSQLKRGAQLLRPQYRMLKIVIERRKPQIQGDLLPR